MPRVDVLPTVGANVYDILHDVLAITAGPEPEGRACERTLEERLAVQAQLSREAMYQIIRSPVITEKATLLSEHNQFVFRVAHGRDQAARSRRRSRACSASRCWR